MRDKINLENCLNSSNERCPLKDGQITECSKGNCEYFELSNLDSYKVDF